ncbi:MAG TPA: hypothetical protein VIL57_01050 [Bacteroidia bacterium]
MKPYFVFSFEKGKAYGGFGDFVGRFRSIDEVHKFLMSEIRKEDGLINGWEELQITEVTRDNIRIIFAGDCVLSYLGMFAEDEFLVPDYSIRKRFSSRVQKSFL